MSRLPRASDRRGFALLTVLCVLTAGSALAAASLLAGRQAAHAARNRVNAERALWRAEDCLARSRATIDELLAHARTPDEEVRVWQAIDTLVAGAPLARARGCAVMLRAAGSTLDVNAATPEQLDRLFASLYGAARAGVLADAVLDWRDNDDEPRPGGAEAPWYRARGRHVPRNDSLASAAELARVRGADQVTGLDDVLGVEPGRIAINNAPPSVLAAVPGFTDETIATIMEHRLRGEPVSDLLALGAELSRPSAESLVARHPDIGQTAVLEPEAWILTSRGAAGDPAVYTAIEVRLVRGGRRAAVLRRRIRA